MGQPFDVCEDSVTVLGDDAAPLVGGDKALCLNLLATPHHKDSEDSKSIRNKIGLGEDASIFVCVFFL